MGGMATRRPKTPAFGEFRENPARPAGLGPAPRIKYKKRRHATIPRQSNAK